MFDISMWLGFVWMFILFDIILQSLGCACDMLAI